LGLSCLASSTAYHWFGIMGFSLAFGGGNWEHNAAFF
jgi:hypothetical protein